MGWQSAITADAGDGGTFLLALDGTLALGDTGGFAGVLDGLGSGAAIDLLGLDAVTASSAGTLIDVTLAGGASLTFTLGAPLAAGLSLHLASDGIGGTDILVVPKT